MCNASNWNTHPPAPQTFKKLVTKFLTGFDITNILSLNFTHGNVNVERTKALATGYQILHMAGLLLPSFIGPTGQPISGAAIAEQLMVPIFNNCGHYSPLEIAVCAHVLKLCFALSPSTDLLLKLLLVRELTYT